MQLDRSWLDAARAGDLRLLQAMAAAQPQLISYCGAGTSYALIGNSVSAISFYITGLRGLACWPHGYKGG
jgi:hypothetical protein